MAQDQPKRPRDLKQWAERMVDIATGQVEDREPTPSGRRRVASSAFAASDSVDPGKASQRTAVVSDTRNVTNFFSNTTKPFQKRLDKPTREPDNAGRKLATSRHYSEDKKMLRMGMCNRAFVDVKLALSAAVVAAFLAFPGLSHAATVVDLNLNSAATDSKDIGLFGSGDGLIGLRLFDNDFAGGNIEISYLLEAAGDAQTYSAAFSFSSPIHSFGIADLSLTWLDDADNVLSTQQFSDENGLLNTTHILVQALSDTKNFTLQLTGTLLEKGGAYLLLLGAGDLQAVPLPAGLLLFLSGLGGIGLLGRYKAKRRELAAA